jgi:hypothetical protein
MKSRRIIGLTNLAVALAIFSSILGAAAAGNLPAVNPAGTWKMTCTRDGKTQTYQPTLKLKLEGDKLTGTLTRRHNQQDIEMVLENLNLAAGEISFTVSIPPESGDGPKMVRKFHGKIAGDTIKEGTVKVEWNGEDPTLDHPLHWVAKRVAGQAGGN